MSSKTGDEMDSLLNAVRDVLRSRLSLAAGECDVCPDGQLNPDAGQRFVAIWPGDIRNQQQNCLDETYGFRVTVTVRTAQNPRDRKRDGGAWSLALKVRGVLHTSYDVRAAVLAANPHVDFTEPPCFENARYLGAKGPDWFWAEPQGNERDPTGRAIELTFGKARRVVYLEDLIPDAPEEP